MGEMIGRIHAVESKSAVWGSVALHEGHLQGEDTAPHPRKNEVLPAPHPQTPKR